MTKPIRVGFIGLGDQGAPMAQRIEQAGFPLTIWARRDATLAPFAGTSAQIAKTPAALAEACDLVEICVVNDADVREVVLESGLLGALAPGAVIAVHSTLLPSTVIDLEKHASKRGVHILDAPVSGGNSGAKAGTLTTIVGGDPDVLEHVRAVFETFSHSIPYMGQVGTGQMMKLLNNNLCYANVVAGIDALDLAVRLGVDRAAAIGVIRESSGASNGLRIVTDPVLFAKISESGSNLAKDVHHLAEVAQRMGCGDAPLLRTAALTEAKVAALTNSGI